MSAPDITEHVTLDMSKCLSGNAYSKLYSGVYTHPETRVQTSVAVRALLVDSLDEATTVAKRIDREAAIWIMLDHPNILPFYGKYTISAPPLPSALVYLYCPNGPIIQYLKEHPNIDRTRLVLGIAKGLDYLHQRDVTHGDLSPSNILIRDNGEPAIAHFGRARIIGSRGLSTNTRGISRYSSPEAWSLKGTSGFTKEADVYAFGVTALYILSDKIPYHNIAEDAVVRTEIRNRKLLQHSDYPDAPLPWWNAIENCWDYDPNLRPPMSEVLDILLTL